jgi:hypothetical protein
MPELPHPSAEDTPRQPTITHMVSLEVPSHVKVAPDARRVAYLVRTTNWKENRAVMWQNLTWFCHYLLGDELDFFDSD